VVYLCVLRRGEERKVKMLRIICGDKEEIKGRMSLGNKAFYANQDLFKSKLLAKNSKIRMYKTLVRPAVTCACEMWVLKENIKTKLRVFERKVLRRIYGSTKEKDGTWRIKWNEELNRLTGNKNIINYIKAQRLTWFGHENLMADYSMVKKVYEWSPALTRSLGRPKNKMGGCCKERHNKDENNKLEGLHQRSDRMEDTR